MKPKILSILFTALIAGSLDGAAAVVFLANMHFSAVWKYVASGWFGISAFSDSANNMVVYGLLFHFGIVLFWTLFYYLLLRNIDFFKKNVIVGGLLYGILIWLVMNLIVLPQTHIPPVPPLSLKNVAPGMGILMLCVGLPIAFLTQKWSTDSHEAKTS